MKSFLLIAIAVLVLVSHVSASCYEDWSRCSGWSSALTGIAWKSCADKCEQLGYRSGDCILVNNNCWILPDETKISRCVCK